MSVRIQRVQELLKREIGEIIRRLLPVSVVGVITVNDVIATGDLKLATVYVGVLGGPDEKKRALRLLQEQRKTIQGEVGRQVVLRFTPQLRFVVDESIERGNRVLQILEELEPPAPPSPNEKTPESR
ncbi:MAG: 30S ribosome-binding factor RbfA [Opitutaceae bacterium]|nr:30S ribosome-binding factor RbfA [Verrucomicrobiales bacterium]